MTKGLCFFDSAHKGARSDAVCRGEQSHQRERPAHNLVQAQNITQIGWSFFSAVMGQTTNEALF